MMWSRLLVRAGLLASLAAVSASAVAWGTQGHQVIALMAQSQLTRTARAQVDRLLALEPGATLSSISTWADESGNPSTVPWHYVNFPRDTCSYDALRDCPEGQCVVGAIRKQLEILATDTPDEQRFIALKYLVHFVADVHQPLHAGFLDDKGGNTYQLQAFTRGTNLHALWDTGLIGNLNQPSEVWVGRLLMTSMSLPVSDLDSARAAEESCRIVRGQGFYPARTVDPEYLERFTPVMEQRLATAANRLAAILNKALR